MEGPALRRARHHATLAIGLMLSAAFVLRFSARGVLQQVVLPGALFLLLLYAVGACAWWAVAAWRARKPDPWAYDDELDGPIAEVMEGRSYLRAPGAPEPPAAGSGRQTLLFLGLAFLFLLAGAWLVTVAGRAWDDGNGAEGPSLAALALSLCAALFLAAGPWMAWAGLRRAR